MQVIQSAKQVDVSEILEEKNPEVVTEQSAMPRDFPHGKNKAIANDQPLVRSPCYFYSYR